MSHILIVGQKFSAFTDYLLDNGHEYTILQDILKTKYPDKKFKRRIVGDFSTKQSVLDSLLKSNTTFDAVMSTYENYVLPCSWISEYLGLPGLPISAAEACTDKFKMRSLFSASSEKISPDFALVTDESDLSTFAHSHSFPLILKPANLSKSLLVTKNNTLEELLENFRKSSTLIATTYKKYAPNRKPSLIVEEFLEGTIHSVDAFVDSDGNPQVLPHIVDYQTGYDIGFDDNFHYSRLLPSALPDDIQRAIRNVAEVGCKALGMKNSPAHIEIIVTKQGPRIVEIGARNGGYRERMHMLANGIDITAAALSISLGIKPHIVATRNDSCAVLELFPKKPGIFKGISNIVQLELLNSCRYVSVKAHIDDYVGSSADGFKMCAVVILSNQNHSQFTKDLNFINENVSVTTI